MACSKELKTGLALPCQIRWAGHDGLTARAEGLPPGPTDVRGLFRWPLRTADGLTLEEIFRIVALFQDGVVVYGDYSGMDTYRETMELTYRKIYERCLAEEVGGISQHPFTFARSCDKAATPQVGISGTILHSNNSWFVSVSF
jgi:hypothetical protein